MPIAIDSHAPVTKGMSNTCSACAIAYSQLHAHRSKDYIQDISPLKILLKFSEIFTSDAFASSQQVKG